MGPMADIIAFILMQRLSFSFSMGLSSQYQYTYLHEIIRYVRFAKYFLWINLAGINTLI